MKLSTVMNVLLPGRNFDGTPRKWYDYIGWLVLTICIGILMYVGILMFAMVGYFSI